MSSTHSRQKDGGLTFEKVLQCGEYGCVMSSSPVMCGGEFAWRTLQVLLEAKVKGLADGADDVLGQPIRAFQDVTR